MSPLDFAVIDTETTGLSPTKGDRIIEIAIIRINDKGETLDEYSTLINPRRDVGPTWIHGIKDEDVIDAPYFEDVKGDILSRLKNAIIVGHNVSFDKRFLLVEFFRADIEFPNVPYLCTKRLTSRLAGRLPSRKLSACCEHFKIPLTNAHSALYDAKATAQILCLGIRDLPKADLLGLTRPNWSLCETESISWPEVQCGNISLTRPSI